MGAGRFMFTAWDHCGDGISMDAKTMVSSAGSDREFRVFDVGLGLCFGDSAMHGVGHRDCVLVLLHHVARRPSKQASNCLLFASDVYCGAHAIGGSTSLMFVAYRACTNRNSSHPTYPTDCNC